jgi:hypothetical protein
VGYDPDLAQRKSHALTKLVGIVNSIFEELHLDWANIGVRLA